MPVLLGTHVLTKLFRKKLQTTQNKCIRFCLQLDKRSHVGTEEFRCIDWLPVNERFNQNVSSHVYKFFNKKCPSYMSDIFIPYGQNRVTTRASFQKLEQPSRKTNQGQRCLSYLGPSIWNRLPEDLKKSNNVNCFKHNLKKAYF